MCGLCTEKFSKYKIILVIISVIIFILWLVFSPKSRDETVEVKTLNPIPNQKNYPVKSVNTDELFITSTSGNPMFKVINPEALLNEALVPNSSNITNSLSDFYQSIVTFKDNDLTQIKCIGAYIGNSSIITTDSCLGSYRPFIKVSAILGFNNETETYNVGGHRRHHDYVRHNKSESDIMIIKLKQNISNHPITLERISNRNLTFYTTNSFQLYRISVDKNFTPSWEYVTADQIKDCGQQTYCLALQKFEQIIGSFLVAQQSGKYLLLGIEQKQTFTNNLIIYIKIPFYVAWIDHN